jgi:protocatechuate 3,4-dioxygenase beta subunit
LGLVKRRNVLILPVVPVFSLTGCLGRSILADGDPTAIDPGDAGMDPRDAGEASCVLRPAQTPGPYFLDEMLERSDIREDPTTGLVKEGVPLRVALSVFWARVDGCEPVTDAVVDLWQCDALGAYGNVVDANGAFDTRGQLWLRGFQRTDARGRVEFRTIYPGWYAGRTVHLHFKVRVGNPLMPSLDFTSQLYFFEHINDEVMIQDPYASRGERTTLNIQDGIYPAGGSDLVLPLEPEADGYAGELDVGFAVG